ncbi:MAG: aminotransferase class I/II-fold pyridoxal phosphate-dependent enzyme [Actinomycetota bacterium]
MNWSRWAAEELGSIEGSGRLRRVRDFDAWGVRGQLDDGRHIVSFASNDYLGLTSHPDVIDGARAALARWGAGAGAARLIDGSRPVHTELERAVADWKQADRAVLFPTGYMANLGVLAALGEAGVLICSDELNHASIVDGCRLARADVAVYPHRDIGALARLLAGADRAIVVSDLVFSMDGDIAPIDNLAELCAHHRALLVLDEAHAVLGPAPHLDGVDAIRIGTLSKFIGAMGGFAATSEPVAELLVNRARPYIFTTAPAPAVAGAALAALTIVRGAEGEALRAHLRGLVERVKPGHPSPIIPLVLGSEHAALSASASLLERGFLVPAIRPPSVAPGSSRLRITLSAAHSDDEVAGLIAALRDVTATAHA